MHEKVFDVSKYGLVFPDPTDDSESPRDIALRSFTLRELRGSDEIAAFDMAGEAMPKGRVPGGSLLVEHLMMFAVVAVNGAKVPHPYLGLQLWWAKSRDFVRRAFSRMNDVKPDELDDFEMAAFGDVIKVEASGRGSSENTFTSPAGADNPR